MVGLQEIWKAKAGICDYIHATPTIHSRTLSEMLGAEVWLKCENLQKTGSFKVRGAFNAVLSLPEKQRKKGVVCFSTGNHSQAVGYAASVFRTESWLVMPEYTSSLKIACSRNYGSHVVVHGKTGKDAYERALDIKKEYGLVYIDPGEDEQVIAGQGTIGLEVLEAVPDADTVYVPVGGGGMLAGIAAAVKELSPHTRVIGVEPEHMNAMYQSVKKGKIAVIERIPSIADGLGGTSPCRLPFEMTMRYVDEIITVSEEEIAEATRLIIQRTKMFAEPSGATALAGLLSEKAYCGKKNICVVSGGNASPKIISEIFRE